MSILITNYQFWDILIYLNFRKRGNKKGSKNNRWKKLPDFYYITDNLCHWKYAFIELIMYGYYFHATQYLSIHSVAISSFHVEVHISVVLPKSRICFWKIHTLVLFLFKYIHILLFQLLENSFKRKLDSQDNCQQSIYIFSLLQSFSKMIGDSYNYGAWL